MSNTNPSNTQFLGANVTKRFEVNEEVNNNQIQT
jgi:hypothetical protein